MALAIENALEVRAGRKLGDHRLPYRICPTRDRCFLQLDRELARCKRKETSLTVMVCDMDGFKQINDRFGHLEGNRVLRLFAQALKDSPAASTTTWPAWAATNSWWLRPDLPPEAAAKKADELARIWHGRRDRKFAAKTSFRSAWAKRCIRRTGQDAEELLAEADRRMYIEKQKQPTRKNRRLYPRMKCRVTIELRPQGSDIPGAGQSDRYQPGRMLRGNQRHHGARQPVASEFCN